MGRHDWVVKVDPDTVFFVDRLKAHIHSWSGDELWWLKNVPHDYKYPMIGALEVFSRSALDAYSESGPTECDPWARGSAEDSWICDCLARFGAHPRVDDNALQHMAGDQCWNDNITAFHPHK